MQYDLRIEHRKEHLLSNEVHCFLLDLVLIRSSLIFCIV